MLTSDACSLCWLSHRVGSQLTAVLRPGWTSTYCRSVGGRKLLKKSSEPMRGRFTPLPAKTYLWYTNYIYWERCEIFIAVVSVGVVLCAVCVLEVNGVYFPPVRCTLFSPKDTWKDKSFYHEKYDILIAFPSKSWCMDGNIQSLLLSRAWGHEQLQWCSWCCPNGKALQDTGPTQLQGLVLWLASF